MELHETRLEGPILLEPVIHGDERGFFQESYRRNVYAELGISEEFVQDNHSRSRHGIVRGMHFQVGQGAAKLVSCARGAILDVVVDIRRGSPTFGEWEAFELTDENLHKLYCPIGFAHGFCVLSEQADVMYKQAPYYEDRLERGIAYNDPDLAIAWPSDIELLPSQRDANAPLLRDIERELPFVYERVAAAGYRTLASGARPAAAM
jgi:dTDP-4-dehydrorhamnose 3,5-epimerase